MALLERLRTFVGEQSLSSNSGRNGDVSSSLYRCGACDVTYISAEMEACPQCDGDVEEVPSETDLGFAPEDWR